VPKTRDWGYWTEQKLQMLNDYLPAFTTACKYKARGTTVYLDLFAGEYRNLSRTTGEPISGSPKVALDARPAFTKIMLFELPPHAARLEADLRGDYPDRDFKVWPGDCNTQIDAALAELAACGLQWAPTFAFVDQYAAEVQWTTLEKLAAFKRRTRTKVELWLLFADSMLPRGLKAEDPKAVEDFATRIDAMYGCGDWSEPYLDKQAGLLTPAHLRSEWVNLMRWRLENVLGYGTTHAFQMRNTRGIPIYQMLFATDNDTGNKIMSAIYRKAARQQPEMRAQAVAAMQAKREKEDGYGGLFDPLPKTVAADARYEYVHFPPHPPYARGQGYSEESGVLF
jgi:three-Cys-motif partner protein